MRSCPSPGERDILAELDQRVPTSFYWQLTLLATLGGFLFGYDTSNIGSARRPWQAAVDDIIRLFERDAPAPRSAPAVTSERGQ